MFKKYDDYKKIIATKSQTMLPPYAIFQTRSPCFFYYLWL